MYLEEKIENIKGVEGQLHIFAFSGYLHACSREISTSYPSKNDGWPISSPNMAKRAFPDASENVLEGWGWLRRRREKRKKGVEKKNVSEIESGVRINRVIRICYISKCEKGFYFGGVDAKW